MMSSWCPHSSLPILPQFPCFHSPTPPPLLPSLPGRSLPTCRDWCLSSGQRSEWRSGRPGFHGIYVGFEWFFMRLHEIWMVFQWDFMGFHNQQCVAGRWKIPELNGCFLAKINYKWWTFQLAMFDYRRVSIKKVPNHGQWEPATKHYPPVVKHG